MTDEPLDDETTLSERLEEPDGAATDRLQLVVHLDDTLTTFPLPSSGEVTIGRSNASTLRIDHPSISRSHAVLGVGPPLRIRDAGSANGTLVAGQRLDPDVDVDLAVGDAFAIGAAMVLIQRAVVALPPRRVQSHDYFEARVEEECARRSRRGGGFALIRVHVAADAPSDRAQEVVHRALRVNDVLALYAPGEYEILLDGATAAAADEVAARLRTQLTQRNIGVAIGTAPYPAAGATVGALLAHANDAVRGSRPAADTPPSSEPESPAARMQGLRELAACVAETGVNLLILGETGVGKGVLAESVYRQSPRADRAFLHLRCAAVSEPLLEAAQGGTVFLDEVGALPRPTQAKLMREIDDRDVRTIASSSRNLEVDVARGTFRQDLFARLNGVTLVVPPLRERVGEIELLAHTFAAEAARGRQRIPRLSRDARLQLVAYIWPGNIRELRNVIERAVLLAGDEDIAPRHLPLARMNAPVMARIPSRSFMTARSLPPPASSGAAHESRTDAWPVAREGPAGLRQELATLERQRILDALERCTWNQTKAAQMLGLTRGVLMLRLDQYGIARPRKR